MTTVFVVAEGDPLQITGASVETALKFVGEVAGISEVDLSSLVYPPECYTLVDGIPVELPEAVAAFTLGNAKETRDDGEYSPLTVTISGDREVTIDIDERAQNRISKTIRQFDAAWAEFNEEIGWDTVDYIPWTMANNDVVPVTKADLELIEAAGVRRGAKLHIAYSVAKGTL